MSSRLSPCLVFACLGIQAVIFTFFVDAAIADEVIPIAKLPKAVTATIRQRYPNAQLLDAKKAIEDKMTVYKVDLKNGSSDIEIAVFPDGKIDWVAVDLDVKDLPKVVMTTIYKKYPKGLPESASTVYTVQKGKDKIEHYNVELITESGTKRSIDVTPKGEIEEDEEVKD